jgi:hypothetical protein
MATSILLLLLNEKFFDAKERSVLMVKLEKTFLDNKRNLGFGASYKMYVSKFHLKNIFYLWLRS